MMPVTVASLLEQLRELPLLSPEQMAQLSSLTGSDDPRALVGELIRRGWVTGLQGERLLSSRGEELLLGNYLLVDKLGEGGMGSVFKARHARLGTSVALKVIRPGVHYPAQSQERFRREIRAAARMDHPHIVKALDAEEAGGVLLLVMELVEGVDLSRLVKHRGPLPVELACLCVRQAALGLQHAYENGVVHRDIKPSNLLLSTEGTLKILDLGLARLRAATTEASFTTLTNSGELMGTPDFMAPEQADDARQVDIRADLYSLGCTLYFLLSGQVPYPGGAALNKLARHRFNDPEPIENLRPGLPGQLVGLVRHLMARDPASRPQTPAELLAILDRGFGEAEVASTSIEKPQPVPQESVPPAPGKKVRKGVWLAWAGLLTALAGLGIALLGPGSADSSPKPVEEPIKVGPAEQALRPLRDQFRQRGGDRPALRQALLRLRRDYPGTPQALEAAQYVSRLPSPLNRLDRASIPERERFEGQSAELVAVLGEHAGRHGLEINALAASPDGKLVASSGHFFLRIWEGPHLRPLFDLPTLVGQGVAFSPKGRRLVVLGHEAIRFWDLSDSKPREMVTIREGLNGGEVGPVVWPDGQRLAVASVTGKILRWKLSPGWDAPPTRIESDLDAGAGVLAMSCSPDGRWLAATLETGEVKLWDGTIERPGPPRTIKTHEKTTWALAFSADSRLLAATSIDATVVIWDLVAHREKGRGKVVGNCRRVAFLDERTLAVHQDRAVTLLDVSTLQPRAARVEHEGMIS